MNDVSARVAAAQGDPSALLALVFDLATENARLVGEAVALKQARAELEEAEQARKRAVADKKYRQRHGVSRDVPGQTGTGGDIPGPPPAGKEKGFICPPSNSKSKEQKQDQEPASQGATSAPRPTVVRTKPARPPAPWMGKLRAAWRFGSLPAGSATDLQPVVTDVGEDEAAERMRRYCRATEARFASVRDFVAKHAAHATDRPDSGGPIGQAAVLWTRYKAANLLTRWDRSEYDRIGNELVAAGHYATVDAFLDELRQTKPWTLADARTDGWAINELASRLSAHAGAA